jgi:2-hydroxychromene-2-carboxylate isomerase
MVQVDYYFSQGSPDTYLAIAAGAFGSPFVVAGEARFWGQDRREDAALHLGAA